MKADLENGEHYVLLEIRYIYIYILVRSKVSGRSARDDVDS